MCYHPRMSTSFHYRPGAGIAAGLAARRRSMRPAGRCRGIQHHLGLPAWYGYLLLLDAAIYHIQDNSFLSHRRRETLAMLAWSVPFWLMYEGYNFSFGTGITCIARARQARKRRCCSWPTRRYCRRFSFMPNCSRRGGGGRTGAYRRCISTGRFTGLSPVSAHAVSRAAAHLAAAMFLDALGRGAGPAGGAELLQARRAVMLATEVRPLGAPCSACSWRACWPGLSGRATTTARAANGSIPCLASRNGRFSKCPAPVFLGFPFLALEAFSTYSLICHVARGGRTWGKGRHANYPARLAPAAPAGHCAGLTAHARHRRPHVS